MNLWVGAPLIATALLGGGAEGHPAAGIPEVATAAPDVTTFDYLGIPAITGAGVALLTLLLSVWLIRKNESLIRSNNSKPERGWAALRDWLQHPILGAGAWTANDSWATNISTGLVVVAAVLGATTTAGTLFPGLQLDRFSLVNIAAGFFVAAAPVVFGILYASFTTRNPGLMADATVSVPGLRAAAISVPSGASITVVMDTTMADGSIRWATVRGGGSYQIAPGTAIAVLTGISAAAKTCVDAGRLAFPQASEAPNVPADAPGMSADVQALTLAVEQAFVRAVTPLNVPADERAALVIIEPALRAALAEDGIRTAANTLVTNAVRPKTRCRAGKVTADGQTVIEAMKKAVPGTSFLTPKGAIAYGGGADIAVLPGSTICLSAPVGSPPATLTIQASDVLRPTQPSAPPGQVPSAPRHVHLVQIVPSPPPAPGDTPLTQPLLIDASGGAKITVTGAADVSLPQGAVISAPRRPDYTLPRPRQFLAPQGTNLIVASLGIILSVNILTMFGIGAELGIAGVLAAFSPANASDLGFITAALAVIAIVVILYAGTATRAMADPQPGSSISSQAGTSFTL
jgi:hypothetical protein